MDTSKTYIKMSEKAEEDDLNRRYNWEMGDYWWDGYQIHINPKADFPHLSSTAAPRPIWLPRQDQLQEMVGGNLHYLIIDFFDWVRHENSVLYTSMEQLWLAFVMKALYSKVWDGTEWIASC